MTSVLGMDIEQVTTLATAMQSNSDTIAQATAALTSQIDSTHWTGQDQMKFRSDWDSVYSVQLRNVVEQLQERCTHLRAEADQQQQASGS